MPVSYVEDKDNQHVRECQAIRTQNDVSVLITSFCIPDMYAQAASSNHQLPIAFFIRPVNNAAIPAGSVCDFCAGQIWCLGC